uniref:Uncharacterized protein n=1 Tax=Odontella aurita TaxID=265563 RepID=A0A7S4I957_9STRA|mmetsp:Transcript_21451/g.62744  ORF Transcript_21451/g.62744 Transcript_21451/m.62744 type:complete len:769 (+) Transcript_21451:349-2655(+)|eukprot:CAMPEP_0113527156 /NCGR_PEP_ID=MMETSP0015_2-20120614/1141_1 /TAXON_ID=2838 /ORGANISM="Odontella" /LENGTH=768 /DNA_ID=CAMNT_0000425563 /DNA_START=187 /DNA_END=2493 /DNA_ORIENTATION=+ /assembly_acc=CAM_ASM_000160
MAPEDTDDGVANASVDTKEVDAVDKAGPASDQDPTGVEATRDPVAVKMNSTSLKNLYGPVGTYSGSTPSSFQALRIAQEDLFARTEVSSTLQEMLSDIETAHALSADLNHHNMVESLRSQLQAAQYAVQEERAVREEQEETWAEEAKRRAELGDKFVAELVRLSAEMVELERWKEENEQKVTEHGGLKYELKRSEDIIKKMKESADTAAAEAAEKAAEELAEAQAAAAASAAASAAQTSAMQGLAGAVLDTVASVPEEKTEDELLAEEEERELQAALAASLAEVERENEARELKETEEDVEGMKEKDDAGYAAENVPGVKIKEETRQDSKGKGIVEVNSKTESERAAENNLPKVGEGQPALESMPEYALMRIFGYLEAFDILSTAQVNVTIYSRVDTLFGLGGSVVESSAARKSMESANKAVSDVNEGKKLADSRTVSTATDAKSASETAPTPAPTRVAIPPPAPVLSPATKVSAPSIPVTASASSAGAGTGPPRIGGVGGGLTTMFSQLRSKAQQKPLDGESVGGSTAVTTSTLTTTTGAAVAVGSAPPAPLGDAAPGLNAAMASSMASKLTAAELSVIISMQTKLRHKDGELTKLRAEKDDLAARLTGVESVKEFLVTKVKDSEKLHKDGRDELGKIARQVASDQEVIAFLDGKVQELERSLKVAENERAKAEEELSRLKNQGSQKVRVLSDMLQFEKEQLAESEREWKAQKKVLVKEVKSCRAQIVALQAERDGFYEQNGKLKDALLKFNGGGGGGVSPGRLTKR